MSCLRISWLLLVIAGCRAETGPADRVQNFIEILNRGNVGEAQRWYADSFRCMESTQPRPLSRALMPARNDWHRVAGRKLAHGGLRVRGDTVFIDSLRERNDWLLLAGIPEVRYEDGAYIRISGDKIVEVRFPALDRFSAMRIESNLSDFIAWTQATPQRRSRVNWVMPGWMRFRHSGNTARSWMDLILSWWIARHAGWY